VRLKLLAQSHGGMAVGGLAHHLKSLLFEKNPQGMTQDRMIVREKNAYDWIGRHARCVGNDRTN
jgi:hypothetical protein